jgi:hypothetical protein
VSIPRILAVLIIVGVILALVPMEETMVIITVILAVLCLLSLLFGGVF